MYLPIFRTYNFFGQNRSYCLFKVIIDSTYLLNYEITWIRFYNETWWNRSTVLMTIRQTLITMPIINKMASISWSISKHEQLHLFSPMRVHFITNYSFLPVTSKVSCIQRKRGQIICLQGNNKSMVIFVLKSRKVVR
jgi:hypothetical protein